MDTLAAYDPASLEETRTIGLFLIAPDGRLWALTTIDLADRTGIEVQDWLPAPPQALVARRHFPGLDEDTRPGGLDLVDLESGLFRELTTIATRQVNIATLSRPTGKIVVFADGVGGPLQRRSPDFELLSTVAGEAFDWVHSPDGALLAVSTLPGTGPSRLTINANDTGAELIELSVPASYRFCHPVGWWDAATLAARCGNTGAEEPAVIASGTTALVLNRQSDASGVVSAVTLVAGDFTADRPVGADGDPGGGGSTGDPLLSAPKAPEAGTVLDVVGVRYDDVLNFRSDLDPSAEIVATAHPDLAERPEDAVIVATGEAATSGSSVWWQVTVDGREAWANSRDLGVLGAGSDALELIDLEAIGDQVGLEDVVAEARSPGDATRVLLEVFGVDAISSIYSIDALGTYGNGVKGERFEIETYNVKADDPDATPYVIGARIMSATRMPICEFGVDAGGSCR